MLKYIIVIHIFIRSKL